MHKIVIIFCIVLISFVRVLAGNDARVLKDSLSNFQGKEKAEALLNIANYYYSSNNDSALVYADKALIAYQQAEYEKGIISSYGLIGAIYSDFGMYDTAVALLYKVADWGEKHNDIRADISYLHLANIFESLGQVNKAVAFYKKTLDGDYLPAKRAAYANIGLLFLHENNYDSAAFYFNNALNEYYNADTSLPVNKYNIATLLYNLSSVDFAKGKVNKGIEKLIQSLEISKGIGDYSTIAKIYLKLAERNILLSKDNIAESYLLKAKEIADKHDNLSIKEQVYQALFDYYKTQNEFEKALEFNNIYHKIKDSLNTVRYNSSIAEMEIKYTVKEKVRKIELLKKEKKALYAHAATLIVGLLFISFLIILFLNNRRLKYKNEKAKSEYKTNLERLRAERVEQELNKMKTSLHEKSTFIEELEEEINKLSNKEEQKHLEETIQLLRKTKILTDDDWAEYNRIFNAIYPDFADLINGYHDLSEGDKRQLIFLKLGFKQNEIAFLMGISSEGVKRARQRLSKKLGLESAAELSGFIKKF